MSACTNAMLIELYKAENNIRCPLHTYAKWRELGYQVKRGEKSQHQITIWRNCTRKRVDAETGEETTSSRLIMKTAYFFTAEQVEKAQKN